MIIEINNIKKGISIKSLIKTDINYKVTVDAFIIGTQRTYFGQQKKKYYHIYKIPIIVQLVYMLIIYIFKIGTKILKIIQNMNIVEIMFK